MKYFILTLGLFLTTNIGFAQETKRLTAEKHNEYGLIYSLPQTHLDIEVVATKTTRKAGPYYQYAEKYLGIPGAITQDSEEWALSSVKVTPYGVPDPEEQYLMQFKPGGNGYIVLDENGLLLSINTEPVIDSIVSTVPKQKQESPLDNNEYAKVYSEELLMSASTVKMAEVAAKQLYRIRESRLNLVTVKSMNYRPTENRSNLSYNNSMNKRLLSRHCSWGQRKPRQSSNISIISPLKKLQTTSFSVFRIYMES